MMVGRLLLNIFQSSVKAKLNLNLDEVFEPVKHIIYDADSSVRSSLVECLPHILASCRETFDKTVSSDAYDNLSSRVLAIILTYIRGDDNQVRQDAQVALKLVLERALLDQDQIEHDIFRVIDELARDDCPERQTLALTLMTRVNTYISEEHSEKLYGRVLDRYVELCSSDSFFVRRVCASVMGEFCTIMSKDTVYSVLLQAYTNLCLDSVWGVRKTTVDVMMSVARSVPIPIRRLLLSKLLVRHLRDESRWVRRAAFEVIGSFICTFAKQFRCIFSNDNGELVAVHVDDDKELFNVIPVAKVNDILKENLNDHLTVESHWKSDDPISSISKSRRQSQFSVHRRGINRRKLLYQNTRTLESVSDPDECASYNLFQYYYDPPDTTALDPELINAIINDNETSNKNVDNNDNEQKDKDESGNTSKSSDNQQYNNDNAEKECNEDGNQNIEINLQSKDESKNANDAKGTQEAAADAAKLVYEAERRYRDKMKNDNAKKLFSDYSEKHEYEDESTITEDLMIGFDSQSLEKYIYPILNSLEEEPQQEDDSDERVPRILIDHFVAMSDPNSESNHGPDVDYHCAFSFPAVAYTVGKENWHRLKDAYRTLASAVVWKVRSTLASSIHEIAIIIEKDNAARDLVPIFNGFIKDLDEVRIGALKHLAQFLEVLSPQDRLQYLPKLNDFLITDNKWNWRLREELVQQLSEITNLYQQNDVAQYVAPLLLHLMQDRVAAVRLEALNAMVKTINYLNDQENFDVVQNNSTLAIGMIRDMRDVLMNHAADRWVIRQTYALACSKLIYKNAIHPDVFAKELLPYLLVLASDNVPNVRLVVARTLNNDIADTTDFFNEEVMHQVEQKLKVMQSDCDKDVRIFATETFF